MNSEMNLNIFKKIVFNFLILAAFVFLPTTVFSFTPQNLDVPISDEGMIGAFSVLCQATSTDATALLLSNPQDTVVNLFYGSVRAYMRRPCINGVAHFDSYNLKANIEQNSGGGY